VVGNTILGANGWPDVGLSFLCYLLNGGTALDVLSNDNQVQGEHSPRSAGTAVKLVNGY